MHTRVDQAVSEADPFRLCLRDYLYELRERAAKEPLSDTDYERGVGYAIRAELSRLENKLGSFRIDAEALIRLDDKPFLTWDDDE
jgi:hypothetical protein